MAQDDFDIDGLASYLHMMPAGVAKLADRGKLPGRRVAGQWRFARAEIHHWLEDRIGLSDGQELVRVEDLLDRVPNADGAQDVCITKLLLTESIAVPLTARTKGSAVDKMIELVANTGLLWDPGKMVDAVRQREAMHSTALDNGVALLHPRRPIPSILSEAVLAMGVCIQGIPFGGSGVLTDIFFLICSTNDHEHLRILARLSRIIQCTDLLNNLRNAPDGASAYQLIAQREVVVSNA
jgi:PTS system nitrogen regulatory IIA component